MAYMLYEVNNGGPTTQGTGPGFTGQIESLRPQSILAYYSKIASLWDIAENDEGFNPSSSIPSSYKLYQNYPNPFNPETTISYDLPEISNVNIEIFNVLGQRVATLIDGQQTAGFKSIAWRGQNNQGGMVSSGMYIYKITVEGRQSGEKFVESSKMLLLQ